MFGPQGSRLVRLSCHCAVYSADSSDGGGAQSCRVQCKRRIHSPVRLVCNRSTVSGVWVDPQMSVCDWSKRVSIRVVWLFGGGQNWAKRARPWHFEAGMENKTKHRCSHWGSNPGPLACKASVITTTLWKQLRGARSENPNRLCCSDDVCYSR